MELLLALLAALGAVSLAWLCLGRLLAPVGAERVFAVLPVRGDGEQLEYDLAGLRWLRRCGLARFTVVVADDGLTGEGRAAAELLVRRDARALLCPAEDLAAYIETWSRAEE